MTLKLIDRDLRSKYAEALYKNESSYDKLIEKKYKRLTEDYARSNDIIETGSMVFLNQIRQKREKWTQDDLKFRDYYRIVCRKVHNNKLENLKQGFQTLNPRKMDVNSKVKFELLQQQLKLKDMKMTFYKSDAQLDQMIEKVEKESIFQSQPEIIYSENNPRQSRIPKLPRINLQPSSLPIEKDLKDLHSRYSQSDRDFLDKFPFKVELTVTDVGKQYIFNEKQKSQKQKRQKQKFAHIQNNALNDKRFEDLVSYLKE